MLKIQSLRMVLIALLFFSISALGNSAENKNTKSFLGKHEVQQALKKYFSEEGQKKILADNPAFMDFYHSLQISKENNPKQFKLKSTSAATHTLDSLLVESWNESSGSLEVSQLEKWAWYENGLGKSWELYDLDSITKEWNPNDKEEYEWDDAGNKMVHFDYNPDTINGGWLINAKESYTYDANNNLLNHLLQFRNHTLEIWENSESMNITYDNNGNIIERIFLDWDTATNAWINDSKELTSFDEDGRMLRDDVFEWDTTTNDWVISMFMRSEYDENGYESLLELAINEYFMRFLTETVNDSLGNELEVVSYNWDFFQNVYKKGLKNERVYNEDNMLTSWSNSTWNTSDSSWLLNWQRNYQYDDRSNLIYRDTYVLADTGDAIVPYSKIDYVNNLAGNPILTNIMNWNADNKIWVNSNQEHINYDEAQHQTYFGRYYWNAIDAKWIPNYVKIYEHDSYGNFLFHSRQNYDKEKQQWVDEYADEYDYDLSIEFLNISYPSEWPLGHLSNLYRFDNYHHAMQQKTYSELKNGQLEITHRLTFYYTPVITTGTPEIVQAKFRVFPNPAMNYIRFELENHSLPGMIKVYDLQGREVIDQRLPADHRLQVGNLEKGIYVYTIIQGREITKGKFIKR